jgi:DNA topoisomerase VI subunit B
MHFLNKARRFEYVWTSLLERERGSTGFGIQMTMLYKKLQSGRPATEGTWSTDTAFFWILKHEVQGMPRGDIARQ